VESLVHTGLLGVALTMCLRKFRLAVFCWGSTPEHRYLQLLQLALVTWHKSLALDVATSVAASFAFLL
jgi:hypothetical protein